VRKALSYQVLQAPADLRQLLLQTATNSFALVLWRNVSVWDRSSRQDRAPAAEPVALRFGADVVSVAERRLDASGPPAPLPPDQRGAVALSLAGMPVVLELRRAS
jgi:hypothetical protein